jgi:putative membrane protein
MRKNIIILAAALTVLCGTATAAVAKSDKVFITDAIQGDISEVALGQLAAKMGASQGVRRFGSTLASDHGKAEKQALSVAKRLGVTPPKDMKDEAKTEMSKLQGLSGTAFDAEFAAYMVQDHQKDIADFEEQAEGRGLTATLAKKSLPTLEKHLKIAQSLSTSK